MDDYLHIANQTHQKTTILPEARDGKVNSSNEFSRGWSLREANVRVSTTGAPHDGTDIERTLPTIIRYRGACISNQHDNLLSPSHPLKKGRQIECVVQQVPN